MRRFTTDEAPRHGGLLEFLETDATAAVLRGLLEANAGLREEAAGLARSQRGKSSSAKAAARNGGGRRNGRTEEDVLESLNQTETKQVLRKLLDAHPELRPQAARVARSALPRGSREQVASAVARKMRSLERRDLYQWMEVSNLIAYETLSELCGELLLSEVDRFREEMDRRVELGLHEEARRMLEGVLLGLYRLRLDVSTDVLALADEFPESGAEDVVLSWRDSTRGRGEAAEFPAPFVKRRLPGWGKLLERAWNREE